ncbi:MAG TPA: hypothetical protein VHF00_03005, partial [Acidimicrobiales bacterium]|nr:hypothetical protein [Acidimicrobiales bacterium]
MGTPSQWATSGGNISFTGGSVGIGTAAPNSALEVRDANAFSGTSIAGSGTQLGNLVVLSTDAQGADVGGMLSLGGSRGASGYGVFGGVRGGKENATDGSSAGYLGFYTLQSGVAFAERMRITSGGNVGVGTNSPAAKLDVGGQVRSSAGGFVFPDGTVQATAAAAASGWTDAGGSVRLTNASDSVGIGGA